MLQSFINYIMHEYSVQYAYRAYCTLKRRGVFWLLLYLGAAFNVWACIGVVTRLVNCTVSTTYPGRGFQTVSLVHSHKGQESNIYVSPQPFLYMFWYIFYTKQLYKTIAFISLPSEFHISFKRHGVWTTKTPLYTNKVVSAC